MAVIKWQEGYNTGVAQFDNEHHKIVELIDIMFTAIRDKSGKEVADKACNDVLAYTGYHFDNEEQAMRAVDYPEFAEHVAEHARLKAEALQVSGDDQQQLSRRAPASSIAFSATGWSHISRIATENTGRISRISGKPFNRRSKRT